MGGWPSQVDRMDASWLMTCGESCIAASANLPVTVHLEYATAG